MDITPLAREYFWQCFDELADSDMNPMSDPLPPYFEMELNERNKETLRSMLYAVRRERKRLFDRILMDVDGFRHESTY